MDFEGAEAEFEPRRRRAAVKPAIRGLSDSEDDAPAHRKRSRRDSSDGEYEYVAPGDRHQAAKRSRPAAAAKPRAPPKPRAPRAPRAGSSSSEVRRTATRTRTSEETEPRDTTAQEDDAEVDSTVGKSCAVEPASPSSSGDSSTPVQMEWSETDLLAENEGLDYRIAENLVKLFEEENTIPFIARYRKELTGNMEPEQLRHVKETFEEIKRIQHRAAIVVKNIEKIGSLTPSVRKSIVCAKSLSELELISAPFKTGSKKSLAERARQLGLGTAAQVILDGSDFLSLSQFVNEDIEGLANVKDVQLGIQHIIAEIISKDRGVLDFLTDLRKSVNIRLESKRAKNIVAKELGKAAHKEKNSSKDIPLTASQKQKIQAKADEESKFRNYFEFSFNVKFVKPHQVLAINRGESQKELSVHIAVPEFVLDRLVSFCQKQWLSKGQQYELRTTLLVDSVKDSYSRLIYPFIARQVRSELNQNAERASIEVFAVNLKKLLLMPPYRGRMVLGIDPGFRHGCKAALIDPSGQVLEIGVFHLQLGPWKQDPREDYGSTWLQTVMAKHRCEAIALGNGKGCRETEEYLSELLQMGFFKPLDVSYTIVNEQGASIYSCSDEARKEFPDMEPNIISAVSIARRLQNPLGELVKVEPKHLGVGMYQHDLSEKKLSGTLDEIVIECVSFVGVDVNTAPHCLLRRTAGLNSSKAEKVIEHRRANGPFITREDIKKVKGIGPKSYEQCAGFIRINPETVKKRTGHSSSKWNPLDRTWIHPESYSFAKQFLDYCKVDIQDIGSAHSINQIREAVSQAGGIASLASILDEKESLVRLVADGLQVPLNHDFRSEFEKPLFRKGLTNINELQSGDILTGRITNTTQFGAFVDIGVGQNGLIHNSAMGRKRPQYGDRVQVKVMNVELARKRIGLELLAIL